MSFVGDFVKDITGASDVEREGRRAARSIEDASQRALDISEQRFGEAQDVLSPYLTAGGDMFNQYLAMLGMAPEGVQAIDFTQSPWFQSQLRMGTDQLEDIFAGQGMLYSGEFAKDLTGYQTDLFNQQILDRLLAGGEMGRGTATNLASLGMGQAAQAGSTLLPAATQAGQMRIGAAGVGPQVFGDILGAGAALYAGS